MTNLREGAPLLSGQRLRRLWFWAPIAAGGLLSALVLALLFVPRLGGLIRDTQRLQGLEAMRDEVSLLRTQMTALDQQEEKTKTLNARLLNLIAGSGDLSTFLTKLDQEARRSGVQLDLYEPQVVAPPQKDQNQPNQGTPQPSGATPPPSGAEATPEPGSTPAELAGLNKQSSLVAARGSFPALLDFMRRLEALNVLVVQSDLSLQLDEPKSPDPNKPRPAPPILLKLLVSMYGKAENPNSSAAKPGGASPQGQTAN